MSVAAFREYRDALNQKLATGQAGERSHYSALEDLLETLSEGLTVTCEPRRVAVGAPDFIITRGQTPVGYVECKDVGDALDPVERSEQLKRYLSLPNLILTNYLEFRWYAEGEWRATAHLGRQDPEGKVHLTGEGAAEVEELLQQFFAYQVVTIGTAEELAERLAWLAHLLRDIVIGTFNQDDKPLQPLLETFSETLLPDLSEEVFADMYAQTLAYGLFSACFELRRPPANSSSGTGFQPVEGGQEHSGGKPELPRRRVHFTRENAFSHLPPTNPFLRDLFYHISGPQMPEEIAWAVDQIVALLNAANLSEIAKDFAHQPGRQDPVVHFYETFLRAYDPKERQIRGVYYTPEPVVAYIVRSLDWLLREKFDKELGLADPNVYILDPACGTGTFLYFVIQQIHQNVVGHSGPGAWPAYARENLLGRIFGFELLMAPYTIAHMKLAILLRDLGYEFAGDERLGIYLTNSLEEAVKVSERLPFGQFIAEEANAAADIKREKPIMVVLGNPPYSVSSANQGTHIEELMDRYKEAVRSERNIQPLSDDYIKFLRFAHDRIERTGYGVVGMITNHSWLSGLIHRGMREELMKTFPEIYVLDLHGNARIGETTPEGGKDENVFDIQQGVAISLMVRPGRTGVPPVEGGEVGSTGFQPVEEGQGPSGWKPELPKEEDKVRHADLWGLREGKYDRLRETEISRTSWEELSPTAPNHFFIPRDLTRESEYHQGWSLSEVFPVNSTGLETGKDEFFIDFEEAKLLGRAQAIEDASTGNHILEEKYGLRDTSGWKFTTKRQKALAQKTHGDITRLSYRPFDNRVVYFSPILRRQHFQVMHHMLYDNLGLVAPRQVTRLPYDSCLAVSTVSEYKLGSHDRNSNLFPLYVYPEEGELEGLGAEGRRPNLNPEFVAEFAEKLGLEFVPEGQGDLERGTPLYPSSTGFQPVTSDLRRTRRNLPHWEQAGATHFITFRLREGELTPVERQIMLDACLFWRQRRCIVEAVVVMPDHVHVLARPLPKPGEAGGRKYYSLSQILHSVKSYTANEINRRRGDSGPLWVEERFDRIVRDEAEFLEKLRYMANNPVKAGLCRNEQEYEFYWQRQEEQGHRLEAYATGEERTFGPEDVFYYAYAVFHSPTYRERYAEFLKIDFPRLPLTSDRALFAALVEKGRRLVDLHLMRDTGRIGPQPMLQGEGDYVVEKVRYVEGASEGEPPQQPPPGGASAAPTGAAGGRVYVNATQYFSGVEPEVWEFHIGGYQVCHKWLKDRKGRQLTYDDIAHYQKIVLALRETRQLMQEIDKVIPRWPIE